ncbi:hypothetical protein AB0M29_19535 [Streptomyces sp. NPDC051976]|uniref:hypothetical protein n=1 Tax=Streptomyces sp. NPDC051976 TaxID=3154947 RepID=UPI00342DDC8B
MSDHTAVVVLACALIVLVAALAGAAAACLARLDHASYPAAVCRAAVAFTAVLSLATAIAAVLVG